MEWVLSLARSARIQLELVRRFTGGHSWGYRDRCRPKLWLARSRRLSLTGAVSARFAAGWRREFGGIENSFDCSSCLELAPFSR